MKRPSPPSWKSRLPGHWIPWVFIGLFMIVLAANITLVVIAVSTFTGLETEDAYKKGLDYNQRLAAAGRQDELGWKTAFAATAEGPNRIALTLDLTDRLDSPITAAEVDATLVRPVQSGHDVTMPLDDRGGGRYGTTLDLPMAGQWDVRLTVKARDSIYRLVERIHVQP